MRCVRGYLVHMEVLSQGLLLAEGLLELRAHLPLLLLHLGDLGVQVLDLLAGGLLVGGKGRLLFLVLDVELGEGLLGLLERCLGVLEALLDRRAVLVVRL